MSTQELAQLKLRCYEMAKESLGVYGQAIPVDKILAEAKKIQKFLGISKL
jgi:N-acetylglutamate synthase/N-acetylornithine aminotransferase